MVVTEIRFLSNSVTSAEHIGDSDSDADEDEMEEEYESDFSDCDLDVCSSPEHSDSDEGTQGKS